MIGLSLGLWNRSKGGGAVSYDPDAEALFVRFTTPPITARKGLINDFIVALKDAGVWSKLDGLYVMAAADAQAARRNWIADQYNLGAVASPTFTADRGYQGDGASALLGTGFNSTSSPSPKFTTDSAHLSVWSLTNNSGAAAYDIGDSGRSSFNSRSSSANAIRLRINESASFSNLGAVPDSLGDFVVTRPAASSRVTYRNGSAVGSDATVAVGPANLEMFLLGNGLQYSARQLAIGHIGGGLTAQNVADLYAAKQAYLTAVGAI